MKASPSLFATFRRLKPREQRVVIGGAVVSLTALTIVGLILPFAHRWTLRGADYAARREQWTRLVTLVASTDELRGALATERHAFAGDGDELVTGPTPALAASTLQGLLQRYADESAVQLDRIDAAAEPRPDKPGFLAIPVQLQARGDVYGLVDFLYRLEHGATLIVVDELTLNAGLDGVVSGGAGPSQPQTVTWTLSLHGLYAAGGGGT